jgi:Na+(H+)/acetate symporter ActP
MHFVSFIVALVFVLIASCLFSLGLVNLYQGNEKSRDLISSGLMVGVWGIVIAVILFGFFSL